MSSSIPITSPVPFALRPNELAFLTSGSQPCNCTARLFYAGQVRLPPGTVLQIQTEDLLQVVSIFWWPENQGPASRVWTLQALNSCNFPAGELYLQTAKKGYSLAVITLSDSAVHGDREDSSGPAIEEIISQNLGLSFSRRYLLADSKPELKALLTNLALEQNIDLILTTGGTGLAPSDITPEATLEVVEKRLRGFEQAMLQTALHKTYHAAISRAIAGSLGTSLIINLPGSPRAVRENLSPLLPALEHALNKLQGDPADCGAA